MNKFILMSLLLIFLSIQGGDGKSSSKPILIASDVEDVFQEEREYVRLREKQVKDIANELKRESGDDENTGGKKNNIEESVFTLSPEEQLKLGLKLCSLHSNQIDTAHLSAQTVLSMQECALRLITTATNAAVTAPIVEGGNAPNQPQVQNENQQEKCCYCSVS